MKKHLLLSLSLVLTLSFSGCSQQENANEPEKNESPATEEISSTKTYKSNLYGFQFDYPSKYTSSNEGYPLLPKYSSTDINLDTIGMENFSNGDEVFGVQFRVPYHSYDPINAMSFSFEVLTASEKIAKKTYSQQEVRKYTEVSYQENKKNGNFKISKNIDEISIAGKKAYQYRMTHSTVYGDPSDLYIFVSDGNAVYKIVLTDSPLMQGVLSSLKLKNQ